MSATTEGSDWPRVLHDQDAEYAVTRAGYAVVPLLTMGEMAELDDIADAIRLAPDDPETGLFFGIQSRSNAYRLAVRDAVEALVREPLERLLSGQRRYLTMFIVKHPGPAGLLRPHRDTSVVDETRGRSITVWCPLLATDAPTDVDDGWLRFIPGSHRLAQWPRYPGQFDEVAAADGPALRQLAVPVRPRRGEAVVFDHRTIHYSNPNFTDRPRWALSVAAAHDAPLLVPVGSGDGAAHLHPVSDDYFYLRYPEPPTSHSVATVKDRSGRLDLDGLQRAAAESVDGQGPVRRTST